MSKLYIYIHEVNNDIMNRSGDSDNVIVPLKLWKRGSIVLSPEKMRELNQGMYIVKK